jgi:hypothetical protein
LIDEFSRAIEQLTGRLSGPMWFRFLLQPLMATLIAVRAGLRDARENRPAFLQEVIRNPGERKHLILSAWKQLSGLLIVAFLVDCIYQLLILKTFYLLQALVVAFSLGVVPYVLLRGPVRRLLRGKYSKPNEPD